MTEELKGKLSNHLCSFLLPTVVWRSIASEQHVRFVDIKINAKKHLEAVMKDRDGWKGQCQEITKDHDTWRSRCQEVAKGILPVLNLIDPALAEDVPRTPQLGLIERCQRAWGWF